MIETPTAAPGLLPARGTALLLALCAGLLLFRLGSVPLLGPDEPRYARVAVEMHRSHDLVTPTLQGQPWMEKPALYYWLAAAGYAVMGENETAARLPAALAALLLVGATALFGARLFGGAAGLNAGFVAGTCLLCFAYGRAATMDMLIAAFVTAGIGLLGLRVLRIAGRLAVPAAWACFGLAALAKGPLGVLLPVLVFGGWIAATRRFPDARELVSPAAIAAFALVAGPWYLLVWRAQGQAFVDTFLLQHNVERFTTTIHHHPGSPLYYVGVLLAGLFPWTPLALPALATARVRDRAQLLVLLWLLLPLVFFSAAGSKLPGYILPCVPPLAILMGRAAARAQAGLDPSTGWWRAGATLGVGLGALVAAAPLVLRAQGEPLWRAALPAGAWAVIAMLLYSRRVSADPAGALHVLRIGAGGLLMLVILGAPPLLARRESGRDLFVPAHGREVLAWGAWRTAWMAGYFYGDGRVREVPSIAEVAAAVREGPTLVLCGPAERKQVVSVHGWIVQVLAHGARDNVLLRVDALR